MQKIEAAFHKRLKECPDQTVRLLVRVTGDMSHATTRLTELGAIVLRSFTLTDTVAVACSGSTAAALLQEPWVQAIEEDRQVFAQSNGAENRGSSQGGKHDRNQDRVCTG